MIRNEIDLEKINTVMTEVKSKVKNPDNSRTFYKLFTFESCMRYGLIEMNPSLYNKYTAKQLERMADDYMNKNRARRL